MIDPRRNVVARPNQAPTKDVDFYVGHHFAKAVGRLCGGEKQTPPEAVGLKFEICDPSPPKNLTYFSKSRMNKKYVFLPWYTTQRDSCCFVSCLS